MNERNWWPVIISVNIVIFGFIIWFGFDTKEYSTYDLRQVTTTHLTAEYSDTSISIDSDGYPSTDTDYWSEVASEKWMLKADNSELIEVYGPSIFVLGNKDGTYSFTAYPKLYVGIPKTNFDGIKKRYNTTYSIFLDKEYSTDRRDFVKALVARKKGLPVRVKVWYTNVRSIETL